MGTLKKLLANEHTRAFLIIFGVLVLAYAFPLLSHRSDNPIYQRAGLSTQVKPGIVSGQSTIDPNDGFTAQALGHRAAQDWLHGDVPYWNHYEGLGAPLAGETQSAPFFPLTLLQHFGYGLVMMHFLLQLLAGMGTFWFFRKLKVGFLAAVSGGVLFALSGAFAWLTNAPFNPIAFLPLLMLGIEQAATAAERTKRRGWILIAVALSLSLYAGFPEGAFISALLAYGWGVLRFFQLKSEARKAYAYKIITGSIVGLLLAGPMLVALAGYLPYGFTGGHQGGGYANVHLPVKTLPALFLPYIFGPIFGFVTNPDLLSFWSDVGGYITMPLVLVAAFGLFAKRPLGFRLYPGIFAAIVMLKIYGFKPAVWIVNAIPGMSQVAFYRYCLPALCFAVITLVVFGIEAVAKRQLRLRTIFSLSAVTLVFSLALALFAKQLHDQMASFPQGRWWAVLMIAWTTVMLMAITFASIHRRLRIAGVAALLIIDSFAMFAVPQLSLPKMSPVDQSPVAFLQKNLGLQRFYTLHPIEPNYGAYYGIAELNVNDLPIPKRFADYVPKLDDNANPLVFTGYSLSDPAGPTPLDEFGRNLSEYQNAGVKYLVADHTQVNEAFASRHDLRLVFSDSQVDIFQLPNPKPYFESSPACNLNYQDRDVLTAHCMKSATLLRREQYMPGWTATINGSGRTIHAAQGVFQSVSLPAGTSKVKFIYEPPFMSVGYLALALGLAAIAVELNRRPRVDGNTGKGKPKPSKPKSQRAKTLK
ncbi:MAG TPA: hypothetical protein VN554_01725 [Verrucomicrobiae bacterium]|nr:hypothetical protein [Verrucomicrobiae bacterium]